jgi:hypothetical protein
MKLIYTLIITLTLSLTALSQGHYKELGYIPRDGGGIAFLVEIESISRTKDEVKFTGVQSGFSIQEKDRIWMPDYRIFSTFKASCKTFIWSELTRKGQWGYNSENEPETIDLNSALPSDRTAKEKDPIKFAIDFACSDPKLPTKKGLMTE